MLLPALLFMLLLLQGGGWLVVNRARGICEIAATPRGCAALRGGGVVAAAWGEARLLVARRYKKKGTKKTVFIRMGENSIYLVGRLFSLFHRGEALIGTVIQVKRAAAAMTAGRQ